MIKSKIVKGRRKKSSRTKTSGNKFKTTQGTGSQDPLRCKSKGRTMEETWLYFKAAEIRVTSHLNTMADQLD